MEEILEKEIEAHLSEVSCDDDDESQDSDYKLLHDILGSVDLSLPPREAAAKRCKVSVVPKTIINNGRDKSQFVAVWRSLKGDLIRIRNKTTETKPNDAKELERYVIEALNKLGEDKFLKLCEHYKANADKEVPNEDVKDTIIYCSMYEGLSIRAIKFLWVCGDARMKRISAGLERKKSGTGNTMSEGAISGLHQWMLSLKEQNVSYW